MGKGQAARFLKDQNNLKIFSRSHPMDSTLFSIENISRFKCFKRAYIYSFSRVRAKLFKVLCALSIDMDK